MTEVADHTVPGPVAGTELLAVGDTIRVLASASETGGAFESFTIDGPRGSGPPPHSHPWHELYYVLEGELDTIVDGATTRSGAGDVVWVPAGSTHTFSVASDGARFLMVSSGGRASSLFADLHANVDPGPPTDASLPMLIEVAKRNGLSSPLF
jgi:quercetin dioxygenase-like cupin family protein